MGITSFRGDSRNRNFGHPWRRPERERKDSSGRDQGDHRSRALHCGKFCGIPCVSAFFTALLQVGELSGTIPEQLRLAAACYRKEEEFIAGMKSALSYPVFVLFFSFLVFALILTVILPSFAALFDALDIPLPAVTRAALALGLFLQEKGFIFLLNFSWVQSAVSSGYEVNGEKKYRCVSFPLPFYPETVPYPCDACPVGTFEKRENLV